MTQKFYEGKGQSCSWTEVLVLEDPRVRTSPENRSEGDLQAVLLPSFLKMVEKLWCCGWCMALLFFDVPLQMCDQWLKRQGLLWVPIPRQRLETLRNCGFDLQLSFRDLAKDQEVLDPILEDLYDPSQDPGVGW